MSLQLYDTNGNPIEITGIFQKGDIVRIKTAEECEAEGHHPSERCAIAQYAGSICRVINSDVSSDKALYRLEIIELLDREYENYPITYYPWNGWALERYEVKEIKDIGEDELTSLFE